MIDEAKIYNLGLSLLIRLYLFVEYLSLLGGKTQRAYLKTHSKVASASKSITLFHINDLFQFQRKNKKILCPFLYSVRLAFVLRDGRQERNKKCKCYLAKDGDPFNKQHGFAKEFRER